MLATILPSAEVSSTIVPAVPLQETNDTAVGVLASVMAANLTYMLEANMQVPAGLTTVVAREMLNPKPLIRRAFVYITGLALWNINKYTDAVLMFSTGIASAFGATLKMVTTNPQTTVTSPWERYVALALFMGPMKKNWNVRYVCIPWHGDWCSLLSGDIVTRNTSIEVIIGTQAKPSFLISERIYQKVTDAKEEIWLLRTLNLTLLRMKNELDASEQMR